MRGSLDYINFLKSRNKLPDNLRLLLDTNGTLVSTEIAQLLKYHNVEVTIALDDFSKKNDIYRQDLEGRGTYASVLRALRILQKMDVTTYLSSTLTPYNLERIGNLGEFIKRYDIKGIGINMPRGNLMMHQSSPSFYSERNADVLNNSFWSYRNEGITEFQMYRKFSAFISRRFHLNNCGGFGDHVVIHPDGAIGNCPWSQDYNIGHISTDKNYFAVQKYNWFFTCREDLPLFDEFCLNCAAISICGGKCIWANEQLKGIDQANCLLSQKILDSLLWEYSGAIK